MAKRIVHRIRIPIPFDCSDFGLSCGLKCTQRKKFSGKNKILLRVKIEIDMEIEMEIAVETEIKIKIMI